MTFAYYGYEARLPKLTPGTEYRYRVLMNGDAMVPEPMRFRTPGTQPFRFLAFGDSGTGSGPQGQLAHRMLVHGAKLVLHTGDLVYPTGTYSRYESLYFEYYKEMMKEVPFFPCPGNHDYYELNCIPYRMMHSVPHETVSTADSGRYYSFDWGNVHFISLDSNESLEEAVHGRGRMLEWLDEDLQRTERFWRVVYLHHPAYSAGLHCDEPEAHMVRKYIAPILDKHSVPLVLNGHEHSYQRSSPVRDGRIVNQGEGTVYITTGGGGAVLHPVFPSESIAASASEHHYVSCDVHGCRVHIKAIGVDGQELDTYTVTPRPILADRSVVNSASFTPMVASGGLISIFGLQLCAEEVTPLHPPLPTSALGVTVLLNGEPLPILMASAKQLNVQLPFGSVGTADLMVRTPNGSAATKLTIDPVAPAIFAEAVFHNSGLQVGEQTPAAADEVVTLFLTGLGAVNGNAAAGKPAEAFSVKAAVDVQVGGTVVIPEFAGLAQGFTGVNVVRFRVPPDVHGPVFLSIIASGVQSNQVVLHTR
jgi:uncharacterized protein (TIGR03437 family)